MGVETTPINLPHEKRVSSCKERPNCRRQVVYSRGAVAYSLRSSSYAEGWLMLARNYFGVGFLRGLNSVAEVFAPYSSEQECSLLGQMRSDWSRLGQDLRTVLGAALASVSPDVSEHRPAEGRGPTRPITSIISAHWSGPLQTPAELETSAQTT